MHKGQNLLPPEQPSKEGRNDQSVVETDKNEEQNSNQNETTNEQTKSDINEPESDEDDDVTLKEGDGIRYFIMIYME